MNASSFRLTQNDCRSIAELALLLLDPCYWPKLHRGLKTATKLTASRWRLTLSAATLFSFIVFTLDRGKLKNEFSSTAPTACGLAVNWWLENIALVWKSWLGDETGCQAITIPHVLFYFLEKQSLNHFLYDRAKNVQESFQLDVLHLKYFDWYCG